MTGDKVVVIGGADKTTGGTVVVIGGADTTIGDGVITIGGSGAVVEADVAMAGEAEVERRGGDGAIGSTDCVPLPLVTPRSAVFLEVLEARVEEEVF